MIAVNSPPDSSGLPTRQQLTPNTIAVHCYQARFRSLVNEVSYQLTADEPTTAKPLKYYHTNNPKVG